MPNDLYLKRVELSNFRVYGEDFSLSLPAGPGVTLISGANGMGKTTFFDALEWGLTGEIRRFSPYLGKRSSADHLTRIGGKPDSHRVSLYFTDGNPIDRTAHYGSSAEEIAARLKQPSWPEINDLYSYLSITHFLGQSSEQRFSLKSPRDQWQALRGPAGVDRLNWAKERVGSQSTRMAFTRAIKESTAALEQANADLADWQALIARRETTRKLASTLPLDPQVASRQLQQIVDEIPEHLVPKIEGGSDLASKVELFRRGLFRQIEEARAAQVALLALQEVPDEVQRLNNALASTADRLVEAQTTKKAKEIEIADLRQALHRIEGELSRGQEDLRILRAEQTDWAAVEASAKTVKETEGLAKSLREQLAALDQSISAQKTDRDRILAESAKRTSALRQKANLAQESDTAARSVQTIQEYLGAIKELAEFVTQNHDLPSAENIRQELEELSLELVTIETSLTSLRSEVSLTKDREESIAGAVAIIASNLRSADTECPVCQTHFPSEELRRLANAARANSSIALSALSAQIELQEQRRADKRTALAVARQSQQNLARLNDAIADKRSKARVMEARLSEIGVDTSKAEEVRRTLLTRSVLIAEELEQLDHEVLNVIDPKDLESRLAGVERLSAGNQARRSQTELELGQLTARQESARKTLVAHTDKLKSQGFDVSESKDRLEKSFQVIDAKVEEVLLLTRTKSEREEKLREQITKLEEADSEVRIAVEAQNDRTSSIQRLNERWSSARLPLPPEISAVRERQDHLVKGISELESSLSKLNILSDGYKSWLEDRELQRIAEEIDARIKALTVEDPSRVDSLLRNRVDTANRRLSRTLEVRTFADDVVHTLQSKADQYSHQVLKPLNTCIRQFSRALMTRADDSVSYHAEHYANRSELKPEIQRANGPGKPTSLGINPNLYFSEGQLAALSVSALLAASTCFRWSKWNALLLDDPLQHSDVIHSSAFADVIINIVKQLNYQVVISTHDSSEFSYLARKFESASVPLSLCQLRVKGVIGRGGGFVENE